MRSGKIATIVLAAGSSTRMRGRQKLLELVDGQPVVRWATRAALESRSDPIFVVTGHRAANVEAILPAGATVLHNPDFAEGLSSSLRCGIRALPPGVDAVVVALGDMPFVRAQHYEALLAAWRPGAIVVPTRDGRRGNPVLWSALFFEEMSALTGDQGAKSIVTRHAGSVIEVPTVDDAVFVDVDDAEDLERARSGQACRS